MTAEDTTRAAYAAARSGAAWKDRSADGRLEVRGADRVTWLQGLLTNDVAALSPGQGCYAAYLTPQGRMIADLRVLVRDDRLWLDTPGEAKDALLSRLETFVITEDVELRDLTAALARLTVCGPGASAMVAAALVREGQPRGSCARALDDLAEHAHLAQAWSGAEVVVAASHDAGVPGFDIYADLALRDAIVAALAGAGAVAMDEGAWQALRVEAGRPRFGVDMDEDTIPLEAGLEDRAISFTKGCYVGQEVIVRVRDRGHGRVARRLMALAEVEASSGPAPAFAAGDPLVADGKEVGRVTSAAWSPGAGRGIGLGYVQRALAEPGTRLRARSTRGDVEVVLGPMGAHPLHAGGTRPVPGAPADTP